MSENKKIKILLCSPFNILNCGISRWTNHILNYYNHIDNDICLEHYYPTLKGVYGDTNIFKRIWIGLNAYIPFLIKIKKKISKEKYDVLHFISSGSFAVIRDIFTVKIAKMYKVKTVVHFHFGRIPEIYEKKGWEFTLIQKLINTVSKVIVIDKNSYETLRNFGYDNISLLPNPLTPQIQNIIDSNIDIVRQEDKIVFVGHLVETKGIYELIAACKSIKNIKLKMIGYATESVKTDLSNLAGKNSSEWLEMTGEVDYNETIKEMLSASVFVLPTYTEGFPNVILESMACGCAIVTTPVGAIPEMLDINSEINYGICVPPKNIEDLREAIIKMLDNKQFALECGENAKNRVNLLYSMPIIWQNLETIWEK